MYVKNFINSSRGHEITAVTSFEEDSETYNIIESDPDGNILNEWIEEISNPLEYFFGIPDFSSAVKLGIRANEKALNNTKMQRLIKNPNTKFDIVIIQPLIVSEIGYY